MAYETSETDKSEALLDFHGITGCDQTSKFVGKFKLTCWRVFTVVNENIINAFQILCDNEVETMVSLSDGLVQFVIKLYCKQVTKDLTLAEARWYLYS